MKVKCLVRNPDNYLRETKRDIHKVKRNFDPVLHPFENQREYIRALNAVKLERLFAKPFLCNLDGHGDGVSTLGKHPSRLSILASGAFDGEVRLWNLASRSCIRNFQAHDGVIRGIEFTPAGNEFLTVGDDKTIKKWRTDLEFGDDASPLSTILSKEVLTGVSHSWKSNTFATCGEGIQLWEHSRNEPLRSFNWGADSVYHICFNRVETNLLSCCGNDRSIVLYDTRYSGPIRKLILSMKTNQICWNPMQAYNFVAANEDYNLYTFDMRKLSSCVHIHKDHVAAVLSVDFSPTGLEFVSGSYDKTIRIFVANSMYSREVYHTKRMQRLTNVLWSMDDKYVISASDEMNIRLWKARASENLGVMVPREKAARHYSDALVRKYQNFPKVRKIARKREVPKHVFNVKRKHKLIQDSQLRKEVNLRARSKPGSVPKIAEKKKMIVEERE